MAVRNGVEYLASLRDGRTVYVAGQRVEDVTAFPPFRGFLKTLAGIYDLQEQRADVLTYPSPGDGSPISVSYLDAVTEEQLERRVAGERVRVEASFGLLGRLPDFCNALITDLAGFGRVYSGAGEVYAQNVRKYYEHVRDHDLALTHALVDPQVDRSRSAAEQDDPFTVLRIVRRTDDGIVVRGAKMLCTLGPFANELYVGPSYPRMPGEDDYAVSFAIPVGTPGLKFICREPYDAGRSHFDRPLSSRFDEGDALAVFDDVLVPNERIFIPGNVGVWNYLSSQPPQLSLLQTVVRGAVKLRFMTGVAAMICETVGKAEAPPTRAMLGELIATTWAVNGLLRAGIRELATAKQQPNVGVATSLVAAHAVVIPEAMRRAAEVIQMVSGSGIIMTPTDADVSDPEIGPAIQKYLRGRRTEARRRVQLFKLAWDLVGEQFGSRQAQYEMFYAGDPAAVRARFYNDFTAESFVSLVRKLLDEP